MHAEAAEKEKNMAPFRKGSEVGTAFRRTHWRRRPSGEREGKRKDSKLLRPAGAAYHPALKLEQRTTGIARQFDTHIYSQREKNREIS